MSPTRADEIEPKDDNERAVLGFFTNLMAGDLKSFADIWADDAVQEHVFGFEGLTPALVGKALVLKDYERMFRGRRNMIFTIKDLHRTADPDVIIVEFGGVSEVTETGGIYDQTYINLFRLRDGKINLHRMHFNPFITEQAFKGVLIGNGVSPQ